MSAQQGRALFIRLVLLSLFGWPQPLLLAPLDRFGMSILK